LGLTARLKRRCLSLLVQLILLLALLLIYYCYYYVCDRWEYYDHDYY